MKICPTCKETYKDEDLNFCLADGTTLIKKRVTATRHSRIYEIVAVVLLALAVLIFLCLVSYNPSDPAVFFSVSTQRVQNWIGVVGANIAAVLFNAVGLVAYIFPALLALIAWRVFQSESLRPRISQIIGFTLFIISATALADLVEIGSIGPGGVLGAAVTDVSVRFLSVVGAAILLLALATTSVLLISNFTLAWAFSHIEVGWGNFKIHYAEWKAKRREARSGQISLAKERQEKRRGAREALKDSPTISIPESRRTKASKSVELSAAAAAGTTNPFETTPALPDEGPPPSIVPSEKAP